jgi:hypothetical protein
MLDTGLVDNSVARGVFGPGLFVRRILYTQSHATKYSLNTYYYCACALFFDLGDIIRLMEVCELAPNDFFIFVPPLSIGYLEVGVWYLIGVLGT